MIAFYALATLITLGAVFGVIHPLFRRTSSTQVSSEHLNAAIYQDQINALARDLAQGDITQADHDSTLIELKCRLLEDTSPEAHPAPLRQRSGRYTAGAIACCISLSGSGLYYALGNPAAIAPEITQKANADQMGQMIDTLAQRLKEQPDNPRGWAMLARSHKVMGNMLEAQAAFVHAGALVDSDPDLLVDYAEVLATLADYQFEGRPRDMIRRALQLDPQHATGLMLSGMAAFRQSDYRGAISEWEKLKAQLEPGSPDSQQVDAALAEAQRKINHSGEPTVVQPDQLVRQANGQSTSPEKINQMVNRLAERLKKTPNDQEGWARLALAYKVQDRLTESEAAYIRAGSVVNGDPNLLAQYADLLATKANGQLEGKPLALINQALILNPKHPIALMMAGTAAFQRRDFAEAVSYWEQASGVLPADSADAALVQSELAKAKRRLQSGN